MTKKEKRCDVKRGTSTFQQRTAASEEEKVLEEEPVAQKEPLSSNSTGAVATQANG